MVAARANMTTIVRMLVTLLRPTAGRALVAGYAFMSGQTALSPDELTSIVDIQMANLQRRLADRGIIAL